MKFIEFINKDSDAPKRKILFMALLSGVANGALLGVINAGAENVSNQTVEARYFLLYITALVAYVYTQKYALTQATIALEVAIRKVRVRIANKLRHTELLFIENTGRGEIYTSLTQDSNIISQTALYLISAGQSTIVLIFSLLYMAVLSSLSFWISVIVISLTLYWYFATHKKVSDTLQTATQKESQFFNTFNHILEGFKEIKINHLKNDDLFHQIEHISNETEQLKIKVGLQSVNLLMVSRVGIFSLLAVLVFIMPLLVSTQMEVIFEMTAATLFIIGPINIIILTLPMLARTNVALTNLYDLENELDTIIAGNHQGKFSTTPPDEFQKICFSEVTFQYTDKQAKTLFSLGPINLTIKPGELLFILGGNGSGKSTLLKLLVGLYYPFGGCLYLDDDEIDQTNYQSYRELFSIIFTDFHLFDRLYGLRDIDEGRLKSLLRLMELDKKTKYIDGQFTHLDLSTGQKKRLAFISSILENKSIYIFDELVADQDPHFRQYFYEVLLQDLKKQGKTIVAVTHDDKYFHTADHILKMEYGQLVNYDSVQGTSETNDQMSSTGLGHNMVSINAIKIDTI